MRDELPVLYIVDPSIAVTGAFISARNTARLLKESARVVLVLPEGSSIDAAALQDFWHVEYLPMTSLSKNLHSLLHYIPSLIAGARALKTCMQRDGAKRLQLNDFYLMHGVLLRWIGFRGQIVTWVRCYPVRFAGPLAAPMLWLAARSANRMVAVSNAIRALLPVMATIDVFYDGYDGRMRTAKTWQTTDAKKLVYVGNYIQGKGQDMALEAFARVAQKEATVSLAFYGGDMGLHKNKLYYGKLVQFVAKHGLEGRVSFHAFVPNTYAVLETAYAALNFSESESFSMTVLEASGAGVAVIATASGGPQEIVKDGITGYIVPIGDVEAAAERMLLLARQPDTARRMGEAGAECVRRHFTMEQLTTQLHTLWCLPSSNGERPQRHGT